MSKLTKIVSGFAGAALALSLVVSAGAATFTMNLTMGSSGADVTALQTWLIGKGFSIPAGATGYFGAQTKAAVVAYQATKGLPATGYFGPLTRAAVAAEGTTSTPSNPSNPSSPSTSLEGTDGEISDFSKLSQYNDEEVGEGEEDVKVAGFEIEASRDGDIAIRSVKLEFDPAGNASGDSDHLDDYIDGAKIWMGDKEVGSVDVDDFNEEDDDTYTKTVTLKNVVVESDETEKFYITVDGVNSFDSSDIDSDSWSVDVLNVRFEDGSGVVTTEDESGEVNAGLNFVSFGTAADTELKVSKSSDTPTAGVVLVDTEDTTDNVSLLTGKLKLDGKSDVVIDEFPVTLTPGSGNYVSDATGSVTLKLGDEEYTESIASSTATGAATITFDNLDFTLEAGDTVEFEVLADIENTDGALDDGDTLTASVTASNRDMMDVENEEGDQLDNSTEKSGTALGNSQEFRESGIQVALKSTDTSVTTGQSANDDLGTFKIKFKVKAEGDTIYVSSLVGTSGAAASLFAVDRSGTSTTGGVSGTLTMVDTSSSSDDDLTTTGNYTIEEGEERTFELVVTVQLPTAGSAGQYKAALTAIKWNTTDTATYNSYTSNLDSYKTSYVGLN